MANHSTLRGYAEKFESDRSSLPQNLVLTHTETSLTVSDKYRKAEYHLLVLPRIRADSEFSGDDLKDLQTLLAKGKKAEAKTLIEKLKKDAKAVKRIVEGRMFKAKGKKWVVWIGFHLVPTERYVRGSWRRTTRAPARFLMITEPSYPFSHLHLHVISSDFRFLDKGKQYNKYHPKLGFFLHINEVLSWFKDDTSFERKVTIPCVGSR